MEEDDAKSVRISQIWLLSFIILSCASAQPDFISIDCGGVGTTPYTDPATTIEWQPDEGFMTIGSSASIQDPTLLGYGMASKPLTTLRYFPDMEINKFCYEIGPVTIQKVYLVRATFLHGTYNGKNDIDVSFDLFLEANFWASITVSNTSAKIQKEAYMVAQRGNVSVCLARAAGSIYTPFISSLELRPIDGKLYATDGIKTSNFLMFTSRRYNLGSLTDADIRYPDDKYDRIWNARTSALSVTTTNPIKALLDDDPPSPVMQTAWGNSSNRWLNFTFRGLEDGTYFMSLYFAEIEIGVKTGDRIFNITVDGQDWFGPLDVYNKVGSFTTYFIYANKKTISSSSLNVFINATNVSLFGPLWSAFELIKISDNPAIPTTYIDDVEALYDVKMRLGLSNWTGDPCLPLLLPYPWVNCSLYTNPRVTSLILPGMKLQGYLPFSINSLVSLTKINFEDNLLSDNIPSWTSLLKLQTLNLKNNHLSGPIPEFLGDLPSLIELSLENNDFSGVIPAKIQNRVSYFGLNLNVKGNPNLCLNNCTPTSNSSSPPTIPYTATSKSSSKSIVIIVSVSVGGVTIIGLLILLVYCLHKKIPPKPAPLPGNGEIQNEIAVGLDERQVMLFTYEDIKIATNNFNKTIGEGGFGKVFYGTWKGAPIAVKELSQNSVQGRREFKNEVQILSKVYHRNLVSLVGYCEKPNLILVYEYMSNGSLRGHLNASPLASLPWGARLTIALDAALALEYLHSSCQPCITHGDVKSSNILIDDNMRGKFGDFGLSRSHKDKINDVATINLRGTRGYMDPVYYSAMTLNEKSDVYSFGVVLLEIISGRQPYEQDCPKEQRYLAHWGRTEFEQGTSIKTIMDTRLTEEDPEIIATILMVMGTAIGCVNEEREARPNMDRVVQDLKEALLIVKERTKPLGSDTQTFTGSELLYQVRLR